MSRHRPRGPYLWSRRQTRLHKRPDHTTELRRLLAATLRSYADTLELHTAEEETHGGHRGPSAGDCPACTTDFAILQDKALALGIEIERARV